VTDKRNMQTILIVDDAPQNISVLGSLLKDDYNLRVANDGSKALEIIFSNNPPDIVLLDIIMPGVNGYEVCKRMKSNPTTIHIPVIFITSKNSEVDEVKGFEMGAVDYITKPFSSIVVRARVKTHAELKKYRDILENQSNIDGLTGIANRRRFNEYSEDLLSSGMFTGKSISVIMMDIDYFKKYNDTYGHYNGDLCLQKVAGALSEILVKGKGLLARYGGEEFVCILPSVSKFEAIEIAEAFRVGIMSLNIEHSSSNVSEFVTISLGVTDTIVTEMTQMKKLLKFADSGLYRSKELGRNSVTYEVYKDE